MWVGAFVGGAACLNVANDDLPPRVLVQATVGAAFAVEIVKNGGQDVGICAFDDVGNPAVTMPMPSWLLCSNPACTMVF